MLAYTYNYNFDCPPALLRGQPDMIRPIVIDCLILLFNNPLLVALVEWRCQGMRLTASASTISAVIRSFTGLRTRQRLEHGPSHR
jgi:hypothetical protein